MITQTVLLIVALCLTIFYISFLLTDVLEAVIIIETDAKYSFITSVFFGVIASIAWGLFYYYSHLI